MNFQILLTAHWNFRDRKWMYEAMAEPEGHPIAERHQLLFICPEKWLPETKEQFLKACAHYKQDVPPTVNWYGYVPF